MATNFQKVRTFNRVFGCKELETPQEFLADADTVSLKMGLIREEMKELETAVSKNDTKEIIDALGDILYVVYGMGSTMNVDMDLAFDLIHKSNMSKACRSEAVAQETVESYMREGRYADPRYRLSSDGSYYIVYDHSTGKILKALSYTPVDLSSLASPI